MQKIPERNESLSTWMPQLHVDTIYELYRATTVYELLEVWPKVTDDARLTKTAMGWAKAVLDGFLRSAATEVFDPAWIQKGEVSPTLHRPGSAGKIEEFRRRLENGLPLFHDSDA